MQLRTRIRQLGEGLLTYVKIEDPQHIRIWFCVCIACWMVEDGGMLVGRVTVCVWECNVGLLVGLHKPAIPEKGSTAMTCTLHLFSTLWRAKNTVVRKMKESRTTDQSSRMTGQILRNGLLKYYSWTRLIKSFCRWTPRCTPNASSTLFAIFKRKCLHVFWKNIGNKFDC